MKRDGVLSMINPVLYAVLPPDKKEEYLNILQIQLDYNDLDHPHPKDGTPSKLNGGGYLEQYSEHPIDKYDCWVGGIWVGKREYLPNE